MLIKSHEKQSKEKQKQTWQAFADKQTLGPSKLLIVPVAMSIRRRHEAVCCSVSSLSLATPYVSTFDVVG